MKKNDSENKVLIERLSDFLNYKISDDEVYIFPIIICNNEVDQDHECFSREAINTMAEKFIDTIGTIKSDLNVINSIARIFATDVIEEDKSTLSGEPLTYLRGYAYMVRTNGNTSLIREIQEGDYQSITNICFSINQRICSICGTNKQVTDCSHIEGETYDGHECFVILKDVYGVPDWEYVILPDLSDF